MSGWAKKRFWEQVAVEPVAGGFRITLDTRPLRTPAKAPLLVPTRAMAQEIAAEWQAQGDDIAPDTMPATRLANAAIDKVTPQHTEVADMLAEYGATDLICYRAEAPAELAARQAAAWDPLLDWAGEALGARLVPVSGVMFAPQSADALAELREKVHSLGSWELAAFHDLVTLPGSLIIGFAAALGHQPPETLWARANLDETWQEEQWGRDDEAHAARAEKGQAFARAHHFLSLCALH